jgi:hypothetical protein
MSPGPGAALVLRWPNAVVVECVWGTLCVSQHLSFDVGQIPRLHAAPSLRREGDRKERT